MSPIGCWLSVYSSWVCTSVLSPYQNFSLFLRLISYDFMIIMTMIIFVICPQHLLTIIQPYQYLPAVQLHLIICSLHGPCQFMLHRLQGLSCIMNSRASVSLCLFPFYLFKQGYLLLLMSKKKSPMFVSNIPTSYDFVDFTGPGSGQGAPVSGFRNTQAGHNAFQSSQYSNFGQSGQLASGDANMKKSRGPNHEEITNLPFDFTHNIQAQAKNQPFYPSAPSQQAGNFGQSNDVPRRYGLGNDSPRRYGVDYDSPQKYGQDTNKSFRNYQQDNSPSQRRSNELQSQDSHSYQFSHQLPDSNQTSPPFESKYPAHPIISQSPPQFLNQQGTNQHKIGQIQSHPLKSSGLKAKQIQPESNYNTYTPKPHSQIPTNERTAISSKSNDSEIGMTDESLLEMMPEPMRSNIKAMLVRVKNTAN